MITKIIDKEKCTSCMICETICTNSRVISKGEDGYPAFTRDMSCIYCGHCFAVCPEQAISFKYDENPPETAVPGKAIDWSGGMPDTQTMENFLFSTRSERLYSEKPVEKEKTEKVVEAMMRASSAGNEQNKRYYVFTDEAKLAEIEKITKEYYRQLLQRYNSPVAQRLAAFSVSMSQKSSEVPFKTLYKKNLEVISSGSFLDNSDLSYLKGAKVLIVITYENRRGMHKSFYSGDVRIAGTYGILMAKALGLASCWMGLLEIAMGRDKKIGEFMNIGGGEKVGGALILGYPSTKWTSYPPRGPAKIIWQ